MRYFFVLSFMVCLLSACDNQKTIVQTQDYDKYLVDGKTEVEANKIQEEISFWKQRLTRDTGSYIDLLELAINYLHLFRVTGNIEALEEGDHLLKKSSAKLNDTEPEMLYRLAQHSITRHQFNEADVYQIKAEKASGALYTIRLLQFDIYMELGKYLQAYRSLESIVNKSGFDYLVRKAKWEDHKGNLPGAISLMEKAADKIAAKNMKLLCWALSNLGDMYSHAGRVEDAYQTYLKVLEIDPADLYCLKGIAWISYSYDKNTTESKRIINFILSQKEMPELKLMLAEIASYENDQTTEKKFLEDFTNTVTRPGYGDMYNKYLLEIYTSKLVDIDKAQLIAEKELNNRFTPETCDWMAWMHYMNGEKQKALDMVREFVLDKTFEPGALVHSAYILAANGQIKEARKLFKDCLESSFELGPVTTKEITVELAKL